MMSAGADPKDARQAGGDMLPVGTPLVMEIFRGAIVMVAGIVTAFGLFWVMQALVSVSGELGEASKKLSIDFVRLRKDTTPETKEREKPRREKPEQQPPPPEMNVAKNINPSEAVGEILPMLDTSVELAEATNLSSGGSDRAPVPLVEVDPDYPERARQRGITGWVDIEFTISAVGTVVDAHVIGAKPPRVFDRAALQAVRRWKYNPMIKEGVPIARPGIRKRFLFEKPRGSR